MQMESKMNTIQFA